MIAALQKAANRNARGGSRKVPASTQAPATAKIQPMFKPHRKRSRQSTPWPPTDEWADWPDDTCHDLTTDYDARLGIVIHDPAAWDGRTNSMGLTLYASSVPSDAVRRTFSPDKRTYITQLEMLAAVTTYRAAPAFAHAGVNLARRNVNHWIDNTGTLSGLIHGYARATDLAHMANAFHLTTCGMRTHTWLDYVPSLANIADLPSRGDFELLERLGARRVEVPVVGTADWHGPLAQWIDSAAAASS